jgi:hypothetical protein
MCKWWLRRVALLIYGREGWAAARPIALFPGVVLAAGVMGVVALFRFPNVAYTAYQDTCCFHSTPYREHVSVALIAFGASFAFWSLNLLAGWVYARSVGIDKIRADARGRTSVGSTPDPATRDAQPEIANAVRHLDRVALVLWALSTLLAVGVAVFAEFIAYHRR